MKTDYVKIAVEKQKEFLGFLKTRYALYDQSNLFFRDLHYGTIAFLEMQGVTLNYSKAESVTRDIIKLLEQAKILLPIDERTWMLSYPEFKKTPAKPVAIAKPAAPAPKAALPVPAAQVAIGPQ